MARSWPPARVASAHRDLLAGLRAMRKAVSRVTRDARAGGQERAIEILKRFYASPAFKGLTTATATLTKSGYLPSSSGATS